MKKIVVIIVVLGLVGAGYGYYLYNKPVANLDHQDADFALTAEDLFSQFENNEFDANQKYLGKIIEVSGKVKDLSIGDSGDLNMILASGSEMFGINCGITDVNESRYKNYKVGDSVWVKGECAGISMDVVLTRCVIVK